MAKASLGWCPSLQLRLVAAMGAVVAIAILVTGSVFVYQERNERRQAALESIASATVGFAMSTSTIMLVEQANQGVISSPPVPELTISKPLASVTQGPALNVVDYRILLVNKDGDVVRDPGGKLEGTKLAYPAIDAGDAERGSSRGKMTFLRPKD